MKRTLTLGFMLLTLGSVSTTDGLLSRNKNLLASETIEAVATPGFGGVTPSSQDAFYFGDFGFRFIESAGYVIEKADLTTETNPPLQRLQIWEQVDFLNRAYVSESPPTIRISVYSNPQRLPLTEWKGDLSRADDRSFTLAGQNAIAYTATGLYESDNVVFSSPDGAYIFRISGSYLKTDSPIRQVYQDILNSFIFDVISDASGQSQINYDRLQTLLAQPDWQSADIELGAILQRLSIGQGDYSYGTKDLFSQMPCEALRQIDRLWSDASGGRFGYRAQLQIWQSISTAIPQLKVEQFGQRVGWRNASPRSEFNDSLWKSDTELNFTAEAPIGQLPWAGVSSERVSRMISEPGCGSCTIDALYLTGDRFNDYLPALFARLEDCGCEAPATSQSEEDSTEATAKTSSFDR